MRHMATLRSQHHDPSPALVGRIAVAILVLAVVWVVARLALVAFG